MAELPEAVTASQPARARIPFFHDFTCRQKELGVLLALYRRSFFPHEVTAEDRAALTEALERGRGGGQPGGLRPVVLVKGPGGMGKSRLLGEVQRVARSAGVRVKEVFCYERQGVPFLPVLRVIKELIQESSSREQMWRKYARILGRVFPELAAELGAGPAPLELPGEDGRIQLFDALTGVLSELSRERPLLILIHDLHRSDPGTVQFLEYLGRNIFLDEATQRRDSGGELDTEESEESWKEIGSREGRSREFITEGLTDSQGILDFVEHPGTRLMVIGNYLKLPEPPEPPEGEQVADADEDSQAVMRLEQLRGEPYLLPIELESLSLEETEALIRKTLGGQSFEAGQVGIIHDVTGGNPLYVLEICRLLFEEGGIPQDVGESANGTITLPPGVLEELLEGVGQGEGGERLDLVRVLIRRRLRSLAPRELRVLRALAALRRPAQVSLLERILGIGQVEVRESLMALEGRDFVRVLPLDRAPLFFLTHEDYIRWVYADIDPEERARIHHRIGTVLSEEKRAREPVRAYEIYEHLRLSDAPRESLAFGLAACRYFADAFAEDVAVQIQNSLLELLTSEEDAVLRRELLASLSQLEFRRGRLPQSKGHAKRLLEEQENLDPSDRLVTYIHLSEIYRAGGEPLKGLKTLNRAQKNCAEAIDKRNEARISALLARLRLDRQDPKRAINLCMRGLRELESEEGAAAERILLLETLAQAHLAKGEMIAAIPHFQRLLELIEEAGDETKLANVLRTLGRVYYDRGNYFRAARYLFRALDVIRRLQDVRGLSRAYDALGKVYRNSGDHLRGMEYFNRSLRLRERIGDVEGLSPTLNSLGSLHAHTGNYFKAIRYFKRSVENSERYGDTGGLVRAFLHLGRVYFEIGQLRQVESLATQILILSQEFNMTELEGEGYRLQGNLLFLRGDWKRAEREYRRAIEIAARRGKKKGESAATLDLGSLLFEKEEFEAALKQISRGHLLAEEIRSVPLQARANMLKGNVYRFLKGGNLERSKECFRRALELITGEDHLPLMWELEYSLAKLFQANLEFAEAGDSYRRAERILERIAATLPEDMKVAYHDDRRRRVFFEDYRRFEKEASGRPQGLLLEAPEPQREEKVWRLPAQAVEEETSESPLPFDRILDSCRQLAAAETPSMWARMFLEEARRLVPSPAGALVAPSGGRLRSLSACDMGAEEDWLQEGRVLHSICTNVFDEGVALYSGSPECQKRLEETPGWSAFRNRSLLALPLESNGKCVAVLLLLRPTAGNPFEGRDHRLLERFLDAVTGQLRWLERLQSLLHYKGTALLSSVRFDERVQEFARRFLTTNEEFVVLAAHAPGIDQTLEEARERGRLHDLAKLVDRAGGDARQASAHIGDDTLGYIYLQKGMSDPDERVASLRDDLQTILRDHASSPVQGDTVHVRLIRPDRRVADAEDLARTIRRQLFGPCGEFSVESEIQRLTNSDLTLKDAKTALERRYIRAELLKSRGNITRAAKALGVHRPQLSNLIKRHNVRREDFE